MSFEILIAVALLLAGTVAGWILSTRNGQSRISSSRDAAKKIMQDAEKEADTLKREKLLEVKDEWYQKKKEFDADVQSKRGKQQAQEKALSAERRKRDELRREAGTLWAHWATRAIRTSTRFVSTCSPMSAAPAKTVIPPSRSTLICTLECGMGLK